MRFFWDGLKEQQQSEQINYSGLSDDELLDKFRSETWSGLDEEHRVAVFQEMENRSAAEQGREPAQVVSMDKPGYHGGYTDISNQITIDVTNDSSYESLDTYLHESNHAYQAYCIQNGEGNYNEHTLGMMQAEMARDERGNLYNYRSGGTIDYAVQCDELDSNNRAVSFMLAQEERFGDDPEYRAYMQDREDGYYSTVSNYLEHHGDMRAAMQQDQAYTAYVRGDISESQYDAISKNLGSAQFIDSTAEESIRLNAAISELNQAYQNENDMTAEEDYMGSTSIGSMGNGAETTAHDYMGGVSIGHTEESADAAQNYGIGSTQQVEGLNGQDADMSNDLE